MPNLYNSISNFIDNSVGLWSPKRKLDRLHAREVLDKLSERAKYAAAETSRLTGTWSPANTSVNDVIGSSSANIRARVRQLVRDFPYFARAIQTTVDYVVGEGILFQSRVRDADGKLDTKINRKIEDAFNFWTDEADISGKLHYYEMMQLAKRQDVESGEFLIVKQTPRNKSSFIPYALQIYEAEWLTSQYDTYAGGGMKANKDAKGVIRQGIEYDNATGQILAYHFTDPDAWGTTVRITAEKVVHKFQTLRPQQLRGVSPFTPGVLLAHDLQDHMDAVIDTAKMASKYMAIVTTPDPKGRQAGMIKTDATTGKKLEEIENGIIEYLRPGEDIKFPSNAGPGSDFSPFVKLILTMLAVVTNVPYELLSGNYEGMNYSTGKMVRVDYSQALRPVCRRHISHYAMPTTKPFYDYAVLSGKLDLKGYFTDQSKYIRTEWQPPGMESIDPMRETKAVIDQMKALIKSPQEIVKARGRDFEEVVKEWVEAKDICESYGISLPEMIGSVGTSVKNNPAAVQNQKEEVAAMLIRLLKEVKNGEEAQTIQ